MQSVICSIRPIIPSKSSTQQTPLTFLTSSHVKTRVAPTKPASVSMESFTSFNYNSHFSVFPAEACEIIGGETCAANMYPEIKVNKAQDSNNSTMSLAQEVDREYFDYTLEQRSMLREEACDDLGGEFCDGPYM